MPRAMSQMLFLILGRLSHVLSPCGRERHGDTVGVSGQCAPLGMVGHGEGGGGVCCYYLLLLEYVGIGGGWSHRRFRTSLFVADVV